jgi:error-prone DNA polymerase
MVTHIPTPNDPNVEPAFARRGSGGQAIRTSNDLNVERSERSKRSERSPLSPMSPSERLHADYAGTGLTIGPHPMALRRRDLALRGVLRAADLPHARDGRRVRVAGMVITRQRPGTAKGFVFLTLEDETGISNVIVRPDLFDRARATVIGQPFLIVDGVLQHQDGVLSVRAERVEGMKGDASVAAHDFY